MVPAVGLCVKKDTLIVASWTPCVETLTDLSGFCRADCMAYPLAVLIQVSVNVWRRHYRDRGPGRIKEDRRQIDRTVVEMMRKICDDPPVPLSGVGPHRRGVAETATKRPGQLHSLDGRIAAGCQRTEERGCPPRPQVRERRCPTARHPAGRRARGSVRLLNAGVQMAPSADIFPQEPPVGEQDEESRDGDRPRAISKRDQRDRHWPQHKELRIGVLLVAKNRKD